MIVVDVIDLADVAVVQHFFNEIEFWLEAGVSGGTFENDEVFVFCGFFYEPIHLRAIYHKWLFDKDVFARPHRGDGGVEMHKRRSGDNNGIDIVVSQDVTIIGCAVRDIILFEFFDEDFFIDVR